MLDIARCPLTVPREQRDDGVYYSRPATLDAYEMLRQLIDGTDDVEGLVAVWLAASSPPIFGAATSSTRPCTTASRTRSTISTAPIRWPPS